MNDLNLNLSACLKEINNIGSTTYQNVCNNTQSVVPWGTADWAGAGLIVGLIVFTIVFGITLFRDV